MTKVSCEISLPPRLIYAFNYAFTMNAVNYAIAPVFTVPKTGTLKQIGFRTTQVSTGDELVVTVETVDSSTGAPTGTLAYANATGTYNLLDTEDNKVIWININGSTGVSVTAGDIVACKLTFNYVDGSAGFMMADTIFTPAFVYSNQTEGFPYSAYYISSWSTYGLPPSIALAYSDEIVVPAGCCMPNALFAVNTSTSSNPRVIGNAINLPYATTCTGVWVSNNMARNFTIKLYDADGATALGTISVVGTTRGVQLAGGTSEYSFSSPINLAANTTYRLAVLPSSSSNMTSYVAYLTNSAEFAAIGGLPVGSGCVYTYTTSANPPTSLSDWTTDTTKRAIMGLHISEIDIGAAGGMIGTGGMGGGFQ